MTVPIDAARATMHARDARERAQGRTRRDTILARLPAVVNALRREGATRVVLFGSLAEDQASAHSDLDLAVSHLAAERYFAALAEAMRLAGCPVDLVRLEEAPETLRERIASTGRDL